MLANKTLFKLDEIFDRPALINEKGYIFNLEYSDSFKKYDGFAEFALTESFCDFLDEKISSSIHPDVLIFNLIYNSRVDDFCRLEVLNKNFDGINKVVFRCSIRISSIKSFIEPIKDILNPEIINICHESVRSKVIKTEEKRITPTTTDALMNELAMFETDGFILRFPKEELMHYKKIKVLLETAGGVFKSNTFVFEEPSKNIIDRLLSGEKVNDKKKYQYFPTPHNLSQEAIELLNIKDTDFVLEPSCGRAAMANLIKKKTDNLTVVEIMPTNVNYLKSIGYDPIEKDFLSLTKEDIGTFDKIAANPPFSKDQDIKHIQHMFNEFLKENGRMVSYASCFWKSPSNKRQREFNDWLVSVNATIEDIPANSFKESGTNIPTCRITINK